MSNINDFVIEDGVLVEYAGNDEEIVIPDGVTKIGDYAFNNNSSLKSVTMPDSLTVIGFSAFECCESLETVVFGTNVKTISDSAFYQCSSLASIFLPKSLITIGGCAFMGCSKLKNVTFENHNNWTVYSEQFDDDMEMYFSELKNVAPSEKFADSLKAAECLVKNCSYYFCCGDTTYLDFIKSL